ncbi:MAG: Rrf2 family transcriptional regulator [Planctomycetales bacterium]|nr:Rrf2 family transcriptional regulator [Planctomycetales bacterium]
MRLSLQTDYALRTLIYLAGRPERATVTEIAEFFQISRDHVAKVVHRLAKLGMARSVRGVGGGVELGRDAAEISIGEVILAIEGNAHLLECVERDKVCVIQPGCRLRGVLAEAERLQMEYLESVKLADVVTPGGGLAELAPLLTLK